MLSSEGLCTECSKIDLATWQYRAIDSQQAWASGLHVQSFEHLNPRSGCLLCTWLSNIDSGALVAFGITAYSMLAAVAPKDGTEQAAIFSTRITGVEDSTILALSDDPVHSLERPSFAIQQTAPPNPLLPTASIRDTSSEIDWLVLRSWLEFCNTHHTSHCNKLSNEVCGLRVIDCNKLCVVPLPTDDTPYCTLSYVWGTTKYADINDDGKLPVLPRTIRDALFAAKSLGFSFVWIDRYCVPQEESLEKRRIIRLMGDIYRNSSVTLIAATGQGPDHGLPGISPGLRKAQKPLHINGWTLTQHVTNLKEIEDSKWNSRAWTYQEALLSRRRLVFTHSQTYFQCQSMHCLESISIPLSKLHTQDGQAMMSTALPRSFPLQGVGYASYGSFSDRVTEYTRRELTFQSDALSAIQGVLREFEKPPHIIRNLCGLPIPQQYQQDQADCLIPLLFSLLWERECRIHDEPAKRRSEFPSWTWAGWTQSWSPKFSMSRLWHLASEIQELEFKVQLEAQFEDGTILDFAADLEKILDLTSVELMVPVLLIRALMFDFVLPPIFNSAYLFRFISIPLIPTTGEQGDYRLELKTNVESWLEQGSVYKAVSMIGTKLFLITKRLPDDKGHDAYERIGVGYTSLRWSIRDELVAIYGARVERIMLR